MANRHVSFLLKNSHRKHTLVTWRNNSVSLGFDLYGLIDRKPGESCLAAVDLGAGTSSSSDACLCAALYWHHSQRLLELGVMSWCLVCINSLVINHNITISVNITFHYNNRAGLLRARWLRNKQKWHNVKLWVTVKSATWHCGVPSPFICPREQLRGGAVCSMYRVWTCLRQNALQRQSASAATVKLRYFTNTS